MNELVVAVPEHLNSAGDIREFVDHALRAAAFTGGYPCWRVSGLSSSSGPEVHDHRHLLLVLLLALPGRVELAGHNLGQPTIDLHVRAPSLAPGLTQYWDMQDPGSVSVWMDNHRPPEGVLRAWPRPAHERWGPGPMVIANVSEAATRVPDGDILLASRRYRGVPDPTSDNDALPPGTAIWLSPK